MANTPKIRFNGFTEEWKKLPLGELVTEHRVSNKFIHHQNLLSLSYGKIVRKDINSNKGLLPASFDTYQLVDKDVIVFRVTDLQNDKRSLRVAIAEEEGIISPAYVCVDTTNPEISASFLHKILHYHDVVTKIYYKMGDGLRQTLNFQDLKELKIVYPKDKEQLYIASLFEGIDETISRRSQELDKLKNIKRAILESLFPRDGSTTPAIRFKGFTRDWKNAVLNQYLTVSSEKNSNDQYTAQDILSVSGDYGVVNQIEFQGRSFAGASLLGYRVIHNGEIAYTKSPLKANPYGIIKANKDVTGIVSALYGVYKVQGVNPDFVQDYFDLTARLNSYLRPLVNKGPKNTLLISDEEALNGNIIFPDKEEQDKISCLIAKLTSIILLRERQLTLMKHTKQALLEQMFVNE